MTAKELAEKLIMNWGDGSGWFMTDLAEYSEQLCKEQRDSDAELSKQYSGVDECAKAIKNNSMPEI